MTLQIGDISIETRDSCNFCCCHHETDLDDDAEIYITSDGSVESHSPRKARQDPLESISRSIFHLETLALQQRETYRASTAEIRDAIEGLRQAQLIKEPTPLSPKIIRVFDSTLKALFGKR